MAAESAHAPHPHGLGRGRRVGRGHLATRRGAGAPQRARPRSCGRQRRSRPLGTPPPSHERISAAALRWNGCFEGKVRATALRPHFADLGSPTRHGRVLGPRGSGSLNGHGSSCRHAPVVPHKVGVGRECDGRRGRPRGRPVLALVRLHAGPRPGHRLFIQHASRAKGALLPALPPWPRGLPSPPSAEGRCPPRCARPDTPEWAHPRTTPAASTSP